MRTPATRAAAALLATGVVTALAAAGCSGPSTGTARGPSTTRSEAAQRQPSPSPGAARRRTTPAARSGFEPWSVSAVSARRVWLLGRRPCPGSACPAAAYQSMDGGTSWKRLDLPATRLRTDPDGLPGGVSGIAFANAQTGWLYGPNLWVTHTGGHSWRRVEVPGDVQSLAVGRGAVWALAGSCTAGQGCAAEMLLRSPVRSMRFEPVALPQPLIGGGPVPDLAVSRRTVAVLTNLPPSPTQHHDQVELSRDAGGHWTVVRAPCVNELGGRISVARGAVWATCPTGSLAHVYVLTGGSFGRVDVFGGPLPSFTHVTALKPNAALVVVLGPRVYRTPDFGARWVRVSLPLEAKKGRGLADSFIGPRHGYAVSIGPTSALLLRTDNGGRRWRLVPTP